MSLNDEERQIIVGLEREKGQTVVVARWSRY